MRGLLITIEGIEGSGKTTQAIRLESYLKSIGYQVLRTFEPGATQLGKKLRGILLDVNTDNSSSLHPITELLLFSADRTQHIYEIIAPELEQGKIVICDRFIDSTTAYQGGGRKLDLNQILEIHKIATLGVIPFRTYLLDLPPEIGLQRVLEQRNKLDRLESENIEFHKNIRAQFLKLAELNPERFLVIDSNNTEDYVFEVIKNDVTRVLNEYYSRKK
ncbi:MAG: dTMP kinase [Candidatus Hydrogenedentes bacterium]|nr:dTMP kinase [Candidatus Hydrogenedentota bacterium]